MRSDAAASAAPSHAPAARPGLDRYAAVVVLGAAAILFFTRLGARALWASEFRWAEIAREMLLTHNYFWPTINGHVYYDKPLGSYWLVLAATWITGGMNEAAARLPSALAAMLAVALLIALGRQLYDRATGLVAAFILATSFSFVFFARAASADLETVAGELAALWLYWRHRDRDGGLWTIALWTIMALTSLTKGLLGFVLPLLVIGGCCALRDGWTQWAVELGRGSLAERWRALTHRHRWFFNRWTPFALALAIAVYYAPFAISHAETGKAKGLAMVYRENVTRYFEPFDHVGPIYLYVYVIFALIAPWSAFLPAALVKAYQDGGAARGEGDSNRFVQVFFWITFIFFTLSGSRRSYYLLPILPAAALLVARLLTAEQLRGAARTLCRLGFALLAIAVAGAALAFIPPHLILPHPYNLLPPTPDRLVFALAWLASAAAILWALRRLTPLRMFVATAIAAWAFMFYFYVFATPAGDAYRGEKQFAAQVRTLIDDQADRLAFYNNGGPVYYLNLPHPTPTFANEAALDAAVASGKVRWVIARNRDLTVLGFPYEIVAREAVNPWDTKGHVLNSMVLVHAASAGLHGGHPD